MRVTLKLGIQYLGLKPYKLCLNEDPLVTLTFFMQGQICPPCVFFYWETAKIIAFIETIYISIHGLRGLKHVLERVRSYDLTKMAAHIHIW